ncbi:OmpA family protein [Frigidibacter mobilis]|uniref:OmpA/MotB domain-containing protein n=1 Tax=Frigidibacter mobilis TaxID=1335048 RepID=A0A159Z9D6_9RHOB|nr:OmpA family protein [Frigidibacter mobilis]AMY71438.1 OmpA/MotB domain-containing protein [Frigidibacter mobilis]
MRLAPKVLGIQTIGLIAFGLAAALSFLAATWAASAIEDVSATTVRRALTEEGHSWAGVHANGLSITLTGEAPTEATRFRALGTAGSVVDAGRVIDAMTVPDPAAIKAPDFSVEVLRNDDGISLIGLVPASEGRDDIVKHITALARGGTVTDMLETARHPAPEGWDEALDFGLDALADLPRSKISIGAARVAITAITDSAEQKARIEAALRRDVPAGTILTLDISAPRPVITPFTLRFLIDEDGPRFDVCSADTEKARARILAAARAAGAVSVDCTIGMGVPSPAWAEASEAAIAAMAELGAGSVTLSDADVSLIAADSVAQADFDHVVGELETALPEVFSLTAVLTPKPQATANQGPPEFTATLSDEGRVQVRGRLPDALTRSAVENFARARFGIGRVYMATRIDPALPEGWPVRALAALEALDSLAEGNVLVRPDLVRVQGTTGSTETAARIARLLSEKLGEGQEFDIRVRYEPKLDPVLALPTAEECVATIAAVLDEHQIAFEPGSATLSPSARPLLDQIAVTLKDCADYPIEVAGHTDSQGGEEMNLALSEDRAEAVIAALMERRILTGNLHATGYGESRPIARNDTEEGREANRRIEFTLLKDAADPGMPADAPLAEGAEMPDAAERAAPPEAGRPEPRPEDAVAEYPTAG